MEPTIKRTFPNTSLFTWLCISQCILYRVNDFSECFGYYFQQTFQEVVSYILFIVLLMYQNDIGVIPIFRNWSGIELVSRGGLRAYDKISDVFFCLPFFLSLNAFSTSSSQISRMFILFPDLCLSHCKLSYLDSLFPSCSLFQF